MARYKQRCIRCKKNMVLVVRYRQIPICFDCQMGDVDKKVDDPIFKKLFDIPREFYVENAFLRDIKSKYSKFRSLTKNQVEAFEKTVRNLKEIKKK